MKVLLREFRTILGEKIYSNQNSANENLPEGSKVCHTQKYLLCCKILIKFSNYFCAPGKPHLFQCPTLNPTQNYVVPQTNSNTFHRFLHIHARISRHVEFFSLINLCILCTRCTHSGLWSHWSGPPSVKFCTNPTLCSTWASHLTWWTKFYFISFHFTLTNTL